VPTSTELSSRTIFYRCLFAALGVHLCAAYFSAGFYHWDEQFQILEATHHVLSRSEFRDLPWEFQAELRPWLQPMTLAAFAHALSLFGITDPFTWAFFFRLFSAGLGLASVFGLLLSVQSRLSPSPWRLAAVLSASLWFLPFLHVRVSSESWSGSCFFLAFALLVPRVIRRDFPTKKIGFLVGWLLALAFEFRYQSAILGAGLILWSLYNLGQPSLAQFRQVWIPILTGMILGLGVGVIADDLGYGHWCFPAYRYFVANLLEHRAAQYGTSPWWEYFRLLAFRSSPPLGLLILFSAVLTFWYRPRHPLTWTLLPFFLIHCFIGHKELRFLFPLADTVPLLFCLAGESWEKLGFSSAFQLRLFQVGFGLNLILLLISITTPAWSEIQVLKYLYRHPSEEIAYLGESPYLVAGIPINYYRPPQARFFPLQDDAQLRSFVARQQVPFLISVKGPTLPAHIRTLLPLCRLEFSSLPKWLLRDNWLNRFHLRPWTLWRCPLSSPAQPLSPK